MLDITGDGIEIPTEVDFGRGEWRAYISKDSRADVEAPQSSDFWFAK